MEIFEAARATTPAATRIRTEAFWDRFTNAELVAYDVAMQHDPAATTAAKKDAAKLRIFQRDADAVGYRDLSKNKTRDLVTNLEASGVIGVGRAAQILDAPITDAEK